MRYSGKKGAVTAQAPNETPAPPFSLRLIVVDDSELLRKAMRAMLQKEEPFATKVPIMSAYHNLWYFSEAMRAGAEGYVLKLASLKEILDTVRGGLRASLDTLTFPSRTLLRKRVNRGLTGNPLGFR